MMCAAASISAPGWTSIAQVVVKHRFTSTVCAGLCFDETVSVLADGHVLWRTQPSWVRLKIRYPTRRFLVRRDAAASFISAISQVRPTETSSDRTGCAAENHIRHAWDWEIEWKGVERPIQLRSCDGDKRIMSAWRVGLKLLGIPSGLAGEVGEGVIELPLK